MDERAADGRADTGSSRPDVDPAATGVDAERVDTGAAPSTTDRPFVDGAAASPEELRAEVERLSYEERQHVDELREEVADSLAELAARFDVKSRVAERRDEAVAAVQDRVDRARSAAVGGAASAKDTARERPAAVVGVVAALLALLALVFRWRYVRGLPVVPRPGG